MVPICTVQTRGIVVNINIPCIHGGLQYLKTYPKNMNEKGYRREWTDFSMSSIPEGPVFAFF